MEAILKKNGAKIYRVRVCKDGKKEFLRIEMADDEIGLAVKLRKQLTDEGKKRGYYWVTLDLSGYKMGGGVK
jgi:PP-loop superfamily ATP-utilizing enzyme